MVRTVLESAQRALSARSGCARGGHGHEHENCHKPSFLIATQLRQKAALRRKLGAGRAAALAGAAARPGAAVRSDAGRRAARQALPEQPQSGHAREARTRTPEASSCSRSVCPSCRRCAAAPPAMPTLRRARTDVRPAPRACAGGCQGVRGGGKRGVAAGQLDRLFSTHDHRASSVFPPPAPAAGTHCLRDMHGRCMSVFD